MADQTQFTFVLKDVITALIRHQGLHEGIWGLGIEFGFGAANFGPTPEDIFPSAFVQVQKLGLSRAEVEGPLAVDAAKVNPSPKGVKKSVSGVKAKTVKTVKPAPVSGKALKKKQS